MQSKIFIDIFYSYMLSEQRFDLDKLFHEQCFGLAKLLYLICLCVCF